MKNLSVLLTLKKEKHSHVMLGENGVYTGMITGAKGTVKAIDSALAMELFGTHELSEEDAANFRQLTKLSLPKVRKQKEAKTDDSKTQSNGGVDSKSKIGKAA